METKDKQSPSKPFRASGHYGSTVSLKSLGTESSGNSGTNVKYLDCNGGSLINLHEQTEVSQIRHRSPSLPPIYNKDQQQYLCQVCLHNALNSHAQIKRMISKIFFCEKNIWQSLLIFKLKFPENN